MNISANFASGKPTYSAFHDTVGFIDPNRSYSQFQIPLYSQGYNSQDMSSQMSNSQSMFRSGSGNLKDMTPSFSSSQSFLTQSSQLGFNSQAFTQEDKLASNSQDISVYLEEYQSQAENFSQAFKMKSQSEINPKKTTMF